MSVLDHFSIIEAICKHLDFKTLRSMLFVSKKCAQFFNITEIGRSYILKHLMKKQILIEWLMLNKLEIKLVFIYCELYCILSVSSPLPPLPFDHHLAVSLTTN